MHAVKTVIYSKVATKTLAKIPRTTADRIRAKVDEFAENPASQANNVKALAGGDLFRLRVGDWRVVMQDHRVLTVLQIGARGSIYD